jgi:hypothetical protein
MLRLAPALFFALVCFAGTVVPARAADVRAAILVRQGLEAQGGESKLRALKSVQYQAKGVRHLLEESERPEGPYVEEFLQVDETDDLAGGRYRTTTQSRIYPPDEFLTTTLVDKGAAMRTAGGRDAPGSLTTVKVAAERVALSPPRLLLTALDAADLQLDADVRLHDIPHHVVSFSLDGATVRVYLNPYSHLPAAVDYSGPAAHTDFWAYLGDVTQRTVFSFWWIAKGGLHLPMQWDVESNGLPDRMLVIRKLQLDEPVPEDALTIPPEMRHRFEQSPAPDRPGSLHLNTADTAVSEIVPGVSLYSGSWNIALVRQDDGIVIFEAPISSAFSAEVIAEAHRKYPGLPIKAVVTTSDAWPHIAGIRQYAAAGIPIYALDLNKPILQRFMQSPYKSKPDQLAAKPRAPQFHWIHDGDMIGAGNNRLAIYAIHGATSERQMMIFLPAQHLLYGSDAFQRDSDGEYSSAQAADEIIDAARREHLDVSTLFMMHVGPVAWNEIQTAVDAAGKVQTPDGKIG